MIFPRYRRRPSAVPVTRSLFRLAAPPAVLAALWLLTHELAAAASAAARPPNVVVFVADDLGWADVGYHNSAMRTPHLDDLVQRGVELDCHYVMPMCTPTRVAFLTGRYPSRFGNHCTQATNKRALPPGTPTLASILQKRGYQTALIGKWHLGSLPKWGPNHYGFDYSWGCLAGAVGPYDHRYRLTRPEFTQTFHRNHQFIDEPGHITDLTVDEAVRWLESVPDGPFFLYVPFNAVHVPLSEPPRWLAVNEHIRSVHRRLYAAAASHMDDAVGRIVATLDRLELRENTLIVFFSDNGGLLRHGGGKYPPPDPPLPQLASNSPWRGQKTEAYEGGIRVPAFAVWPRGFLPSKIEAPVHAVDWLPTIAGVAGAADAMPADLDGQDLRELLSGKTADLPPRTLYWVTHEDRRLAAVRRGRWKLIGSRNEPWELYDLLDDPHETTDLADQRPEKVQQLKRFYADEMAKDNLPAGF